MMLPESPWQLRQYIMLLDGAYHKREALELSYLLPAAYSDRVNGTGRVHMIQTANQPEGKDKNIPYDLTQ